MDLESITDRLIASISGLRFDAPIAVVYNPLIYARRSYSAYLETYAGAPKKVVLVGMNPGPWGMAQTGVPFGEVAAVRDWMGIVMPVGKPPRQHPKRPVEGFACRRSEVSGRRLWGWARQIFGKPENFFKDFIVLNYCPLVFMEASGRNRTPDKIKIAQRKILFDACDRALARSIAFLKPAFVLGIGRFAEDRIRKALDGRNLNIGGITHPSPANPKANRGWSRLATTELRKLGVHLPEAVCKQDDE
jgi:single-strand selective monofunctional uracil DNA glycosylase